MTEVNKLTKKEKEALSKRWNKEMEKMAEIMRKEHEDMMEKLIWGEHDNNRGR